MTTYEIDGADTEDVLSTDHPCVLVTAAARRVGLIGPLAKIDESLIDYAREIVTIAARIGDRSTNLSCEEDTVGDDIRAQPYNV
ncbi:MAG: hypothetical protein EOP12_02980 [Pseudomonas sp.]|nr:MAG: hypothetical protein EOP12_02980 [Pseudomonas sp.]